MKDKLVKTGHKKGFYRIRFVGKALAFASILALGSALPIVIVANASVKETNAQNATVSDNTEIDVGHSDNEEVIRSYAD